MTQSRPRVLVVDDDVTFLTFVCGLLERLNVRPEVSMAGAEALRQLARGGWAGVLLDLRLPDIHGLKVLSSLRLRGGAVPVVVLTGAGNVANAVEAMRLGALDFLEKPISSLTLTAAVSRLLAADRGLLPVTTDRPTESSAPPFLSDRVLRLASVVVCFLKSPRDVRTVDALCRAAGVYVAPRTFRAWCRAEGVRAGGLLDLARVLRAHGVAATGACRVVECLDADERTARALVLRGFPGPRLPESSGSLVDLCLSQGYVSHPGIVRAIVRQLGNIDGR